MDERNNTVRDLTPEEIQSVCGGWDWDTAANYWMEDVNSGYEISAPGQGVDWVFDNGGDGWGYMVDDQDHLVGSGLIEGSS